MTASSFNDSKISLLAAEAQSAATSVAALAAHAHANKHNMRSRDDSTLPLPITAAAIAASAAGTYNPPSPTHSERIPEETASQASSADNKTPSHRMNIGVDSVDQQKFIDELIKEIKLNTDPILTGYKNKLIWFIALYCGTAALSTAYSFGQDFCKAIDSLGLGEMSAGDRMIVSIVCAALGGGTDFALDTVSILNTLSRFDFKKAWKNKDIKTILKILFVVLPSTAPNIKSGLDNNSFGGKDVAPALMPGRFGSAAMVNGKFFLVDQPKKIRVGKDDPVIKMIAAARTKLNDAKKAYDKDPTQTTDYINVLGHLIDGIRRNRKQPTKLNPNTKNANDQMNSENLHNIMTAIQAMAKTELENNESKTSEQKSSCCASSCVSKVPSIFFSTVASLQYAICALQFAGYVDLADLFTSSFELKTIPSAYLAAVCFYTNFCINQVAYLDLSEKITDRLEKGINNCHANWDTVKDVMKETFFGSANIAYGIIYAAYAFQYSVYDHTAVKAASGILAFPAYVGLGKLTSDDGRSIYSAMLNKKLLNDALNNDPTGTLNGAFKTKKSLDDYFARMNTPERQQAFIEVSHRYALTLFESLEDYFYNNPSQNVLNDSLFKELESAYPPEQLVPTPKPETAATTAATKTNGDHSETTSPQPNPSAYTSTSYFGGCVNFFRSLCGGQRPTNNIHGGATYSDAVPPTATETQNKSVFVAATPEPRHYVPPANK